MRNPRLSFFWILLAIVTCLPLAAQTGSSEQATTSTASGALSATDRLFLSFAEEATLVDRQWWEGQFEYADGSNMDVILLRGVVAFQPWKRWEMGARVGFGNTDTRAGVADGTGATDLDA